MSSAQKGTLIELLRERANIDPDTTAFTFGGAATTFAELWQSLQAFAASLLSSGIAAGDRVVIALPNGADFFTAFYGAQAAGGIAVPLYPGSGTGRILDVARRCDARHMVVQPERMTAELQTAAAADARQVWTVAAAHRASPVQLPTVKPADVSFIQYTSGSTGEPKGVQISHQDLLINIDQLARGMEITADDVFVSWLPVCHDMGLILMTMVPFAVGASLHLLPSRLAQIRTWVETIESHRATFTAAPDFAYRLCGRLVRDPGAFDLSSLRVALNAAEPVRPTTVEAFESAFGLHQVIVPGYGLAEATVGVTTRAPASPIQADERGLVALGRGLPGVRLRIDGANGPAPAGRQGEVLVASPATTRGYWGDPLASDALYTNDGFIRTGDIGYLDNDGELYIVGRRKSVIFQGGLTIAPQEVEETIDGLPFVRRSAAVGIDRGRIEGEQVYVFAELEPREAGQPERWQELIRATVRTFNERMGFRPGRIYFLRSASIPLTSNGKVRHQELRQRYLSGELRESGRTLFPDY
jgi:acyl-CoA synthetase (AMP-forming)/AMP-acid ligase II